MFEASRTPSDGMTSRGLRAEHQAVADEEGLEFTEPCDDEVGRQFLDICRRRGAAFRLLTLLATLVVSATTGALAVGAQRRREARARHRIELEERAEVAAASAQRPAAVNSGVLIELVVSAACSDDNSWVAGIDCSNTIVYLYSRCESKEVFKKRLLYDIDAEMERLPECVRLAILPHDTNAAYVYHLASHHERIVASSNSSGALVFQGGRAEWSNGPLGAVAYAREWSSVGVGFATLSWASCEREGFTKDTKNTGHDQFEDLVWNLFGFLTNGRGSQGNWFATVGGQFFVSTRRAGRVPGWVYEYLLDFLLTMDVDDKQRRKDKGQRPQEAAVERLWNVMFGCWAPVPESLEGLRAVYPACMDDCTDGAKGVASCGPNAPQVAWPDLPQEKQEWMSAMMAPSGHTFPAYTKGELQILRAEGYLSPDGMGGWQCEPLFPEVGPRSGYGVCSMEAWDNYAMLRQMPDSAAMLWQMTDFFTDAGTGGACSNLDEIRLGNATREVGMRACGKKCLLYGECTGFSWQEYSKSCTLHSGACAQGGDDPTQLYVRSVPPPKKEVVLAGYCKDDFEWLRDIDCLTTVVFLYTKCDSTNPLGNIPSEELPPCVAVEILSNVGREGGTYFYHLKTHHERLALPVGSPRALVFLQGEVEWDGGPLDVVEYASEVVLDGVGFAPLSWAGCGVRGPWLTAECGEACWKSRDDLLRNLFVFLTNHAEPLGWMASYRGQFALSKRRAARVPLWLLDYSLGLLNSEETSRAWYGMAFERLWNVLFGCWTGFPESGTKEALLGAYPSCLDDCDRSVSVCGPQQPVPWEGQAAPVSKSDWISSMLAPVEDRAVLSRAKENCSLKTLRSEGFSSGVKMLGWTCVPLFLSTLEGHGVCTHFG